MLLSMKAKQIVSVDSLRLLVPCLFAELTNDQFLRISQRWFSPVRVRDKNNLLLQRQRVGAVQLIV